MLKKSKFYQTPLEYIFSSIEKHNMYVQSIVPEKDLLVWNLKEGWEPLCSFLDKPIPEDPFPHENKIGDLEWGRNYGLKYKMIDIAKKNFAKNLALFIFKSLIGLYIIFVCYQRLYH